MTDECPNCGALGTVGDPHDPDCPLHPVYATKKADKVCRHPNISRLLVNTGGDLRPEDVCTVCGQVVGGGKDAPRTIEVQLNRIEGMLAEALARKPLFVAETRALRPNDSGTDWVRDGVGSSEEEKMIAHNHVHRRIDELSDKLLKLAAFVTARFEADSAALDSHERRLVTFDGVMGEHEAILDSHNNTLDLMNNTLDRHSDDLVSMFDRLSKLEAIEAQRRGDSK